MWKRVLLISAICSSLCISQHYVTLDDALIYARYVQNALDGQGLVFNAGERINALTSPLLGVLLLATSWLLHGHVLLAELVLSTCFLIGASSLAEAMAPYSGLLLASTAFFYSCFGMETTLFLFMLMLCVFLFVKERYALLPLVAVLTVLTRFEGALMAVILLWRLWRERRLPRPVAFLPALAVALAYIGFNVYFYGHLLPSSTTAKLMQGYSGYWGPWPRAFFHLYPALYERFIPSFYIVPGAFVLAFVAAWKLRGSRLNQVVLPFLAGLLVFYVAFNIPNYYWYYAPFVCFGIFYAVLALPRTRATSIVLSLVIAECAITGILQLRHSGPVIAYRDMSAWINTHTAPDAKIAAVEIGTVGWNCKRNVDDIIGLTNPKNAALIAHRDLRTWLAQDKPDYVIMHQKPLLGEIAAAESADYSYLPVHYGGIYLMRRKDSSR